MQKWEYCVLRTKELKKGGTFGGFNTQLHISYFSPEGKHKEQVVAEGIETSGYPPSEKWENSYSIKQQYIAWLGEQGWEVFHIDEKWDWWYFKRLKEE